MAETFVQLECPRCGKAWEERPSQVPEPSSAFSCPDCDHERPLSEFARTKRDMETIETFAD